jgi:protein-S-isoprenylcysteine O-methyltransferase Ste14
VKEFFHKHRHTFTNLFLIICLGRYAFDQAAQAWMANRFDFVEVAFAAHNVVMLTIILVRKQHQTLDQNIFHQGIAFVAFFSGILYLQAPTLNSFLLRISQAVIVVSICLGIITFIHLGRSFGILIALRKVKTCGLYGIIRHPMYFTDILWRVGFILKNPCVLNFTIFVVSSACYIYRAILEEKFLSQYPEYFQYMQRVKYRFLPGIF